jgi:hypothetical protein
MYRRETTKIRTDFLPTLPSKKQDNTTRHPTYWHIREIVNYSTGWWVGFLMYLSVLLASQRSPLSSISNPFGLSHELLGAMYRRETTKIRTDFLPTLPSKKQDNTTRHPTYWHIREIVNYSTLPNLPWLTISCCYFSFSFFFFDWHRGVFSKPLGSAFQKRATNNLPHCLLI